MIREALRMTRGYRKRIAVSAGAGVLRVAAGLAFVALSKRAVDIATGDAGGSLAGCVAALAGAVLLEMLCAAVASRTTELSEATMKNALQSRLFGRLLRSRWTGREALHSADMLSRLTEDCRVAAVPYRAGDACGGVSACRGVRVSVVFQPCACLDSVSAAAAVHACGKGVFQAGAALHPPGARHRKPPAGADAGKPAAPHSAACIRVCRKDDGEHRCAA